MEKKIITVIVSPCYTSGGGWRVWSAASVRENKPFYINSLEELNKAEEDLVRTFGAMLRPQSGLSIVIRPRWNDDERSFHEWRSFNGEDFQRVVFKAP